MGNQICSSSSAETEPAGHTNNLLQSYDRSLSSLDTQDDGSPIRRGLHPEATRVDRKHFSFLSTNDDNNRPPIDNDEATAPSHSSNTTSNSGRPGLEQDTENSEPLVKKLWGHVKNFVQDVLVDDNYLHNDTHSEPPPRRVRGGVRLEGCGTDNEHFEKLDLILEAMADRHGLEGLAVAGLDYNRIENDKDSNGWLRLCHGDTVLTRSNRRHYVADGPMYDEVARCCMEYAQDLMMEEGDLEWITIGNDDTDGIQDNTTSAVEKEPIRALVSKGMMTIHKNRPTLLVVTGRGKVRAGIFSRQHIQVTGLEPSTALGIVRDARQRNMNVVLLDPNVHTDKKAMTTVAISMTKLFESQHNHNNNDDHREKRDRDNDKNENQHHHNGNHNDDAQPPPTPPPPPLYIQAHSCAGSYIVRHLMDQYNQHYQQRLQAVVFTDSTHNIRWLAKPVHQNLQVLLEGPRTVYFRSCRDTPHTAGTEANTDEYWQHRFGTVRSCWAGTTEHSLSDWYARDHIWEHLDRWRVDANQDKQQADDQEEEEEEGGKMNR